VRLTFSAAFCINFGSQGSRRAERSSCAVNLNLVVSRRFECDERCASVMDAFLLPIFSVH
jgi:hypothetical protein